MRYKHGLSRTPEWCAWYNMLKRCHDQQHKNFKEYGGRGITVCTPWRSSFEAFLKDMGQRPSAKHTLDRIDNDGNYEQSNCRWATRCAQSRNRGMTRMVEFRGESRPLGEWAQLLGIGYKSLNSRLNNYGWSTERALTTAIAPRRR